MYKQQLQIQVDHLLLVTAVVLNEGSTFYHYENLISLNYLILFINRSR